MASGLDHSGSKEIEVNGLPAEKSNQTDCLASDTLDADSPDEIIYLPIV